MSDRYAFFMNPNSYPDIGQQHLAWLWKIMHNYPADIRDQILTRVFLAKIRNQPNLTMRVPVQGESGVLGESGPGATEEIRINQLTEFLNFIFRTISDNTINIFRNIARRLRQGPGANPLYNYISEESNNNENISQIIEELETYIIRSEPERAQKLLDDKTDWPTDVTKIVKDFTKNGGRKTRKTKKVRKHRGVVQTGGNKGKLKKGYKYTGKRLKNGLSEIKKVKAKK